MCDINQKWYFHFVISIFISSVRAQSENFHTEDLPGVPPPFLLEFKTSAAALAPQTPSAALWVFSPGYRRRLSVGSGSTLLSFPWWGGGQACPPDFWPCHSHVWKEDEEGRDSTLVRKDPAQPLDQVCSVNVICWLIQGKTSTFLYLWCGPEDSIYL